MMKNKREGCAFIPYRKAANGYEFYFQKRDMNAPVHKGIFSMFGGGKEGSESPQECCIRETQEELVYAPKEMQYFSVVETATNIFHVFIEEVGKDFETLVNVQEGEYGKFLTLADFDHIQASPEARFLAYEIANELNK